MVSIVAPEGPAKLFPCRGTGAPRSTACCPLDSARCQAVSDEPPKRTGLVCPECKGPVAVIDHALQEVPKRPPDEPAAGHRRRP